MPALAGLLLWIDPWWFIHNGDSRGLDSVLGTNQYSLDLTQECPHFPVVAG
jgi:hypothetical protein